LTAEVGILKAVLVVLRGIILNLFLFVPYILGAAALLTFLYGTRISMENPFTGNEINFNINITDVNNEITTNNAIESKLDCFDNNATSRFECREDTITFEEYTALKKKLEKSNSRLGSFWVDVFNLPLILLTLIILVLWPIYNLLSRRRLRFSNALTISFSLVLIVLLLNLFGMFTAYLKFFELHYSLSFSALVAFFVPKLLKPGSATEAKNKMSKVLLNLILFLIVPLTLLFIISKLIIFFSYCGDYALVSNGIYNWDNILFTCLIILLVWILTELSININKISFHNFYRDRLSKTFLIRNSEFEKSRPYSNVYHDDELTLSSLKNSKAPYQIINCNLNLSKKLPDDFKYGEDKWCAISSLDKEGVLRKGESFVFSQEYIGSEQTGYYDSEKYYSTDNHVNVGTAMAISGAAFNVGMGLKDVWYVRFLMALFNLRLGYWAVNPKKLNDNIIIAKISHKFKPGGYLALKGILGDYKKDDDFVNITDGGHFENLGVYELLRRRCKYIIVGNASADPKMTFKELSNLIRLARIDFGIIIDIDVSNLILDENGISKSNCAMGIIRYPCLNNTEEEIGYLLLCKTALTGNEPPLLYEYKKSDPSFPHQSTVDQFFDEKQFEAYRELGYQVGKQALSVYDDKEKMEMNFIKMKQHFYPYSLVIKEKFTKHIHDLNKIYDELKTNKNLEFLNCQIYPEWEKFMKLEDYNIDRFTGKSYHDFEQGKLFWLPGTHEERKESFYICNSMIQLMEDVYMDLELENEYNHPDNRGWMNLFKHWSWTGIYRITWAISACTYGVRFQEFCKKHFELTIGDINVIVEKDGYEDHVNPFELNLINKFKDEIKDKKFVRFTLSVKNVINADEKFEFNYGFAFLEEKDNNKHKIIFFRVQDHLRGMGLGRNTLRKLKEDFKVVEIEKNDKIRKSIKGIEEENSLSNLRILFDSVLSERINC
jgi:hypothetical protein